LLRQRKWRATLDQSRAGGALFESVCYGMMATVMSTPESAPIVFVVDDDESVREALASLVRSADMRVEVFPTAQEISAPTSGDAPSCLVLDVRLQGDSGLDLQRRLTELNTEIPIIFITGYGDVPTLGHGHEGRRD
jgi:FixJ family two-component response regulator